MTRTGEAVTQRGTRGWRECVTRYKARWAIPTVKFDVRPETLHEHWIIDKDRTENVVHVAQEQFLLQFSEVNEPAGLVIVTGFSNNNSFCYGRRIRVEIAL